METGESSASTKLNKDINYDRVEDEHEAEAIILYPSFGAPLIAKPGQPVRLYLLFEEKLHFLHDSEIKSNSAKKAPKTIEVINKSLKILPWDKGKKNAGKLLFPSQASALANIHCHFIRDMSGRRRLVAKEKLFGLLRPKTGEYYMSHELGFRYLFELEIHHLALGKGLYDCAWEIHDRKSPCNSMKPPLPIPERQDILAQEFLRKKGNIRRKDEDIDIIDQLTGYKIEKEGEFQFAANDDLPLINHHPIYITTEPKLNIGQLTDIHISSRQLPMRACEAQVLPGADKTLSPKIGSLVNVSFDTFKNLLDRMGEDDTVHLLALTGDLIDFNQNFNPIAADANWKTHFIRPATLWQWMDPKYYAGKGNDPRIYPFYIDMLTVYSLLYYYMKTYKKPIIMLTGNHEAYEKPYGVSPRLFQFGGLKPEGIIKANEGIPADHNLTIYEATLLYGPSYNRYENKWNFESKYLEWFYMMYNPLSDFSFTYGTGQDLQSFTALEWEDEEQYIENYARGGGTLPRATRAISDLQLELLKESKKHGHDRILLTHFTFVSYSYDLPLTHAGEVNYSNEGLSSYIPGVGASMGHCEEGTFIKNRKEVYNLLYDGAFTHVFSGHTHRAGFYIMTDKTGLLSSNVKVQAHLIEENNMLHPSALLKNGKARFIVGASGGPIPGQNYYGDTSQKGLGNWSLDYPSGNVLKFNGTKDTLHLKKPSKLPASQPRFAVALSFFDTTNNGVFQKFESGKNKKDNEFEIDIHTDLPGERFIEEITLYAYLNGKWESISMGITSNGMHQLKAVVGGSNPDQLKNLVLKRRSSNLNSKQFLSVTFNKSLATRAGYKQYNYDSPWIFPVQLIDKKKEAQAIDHTVAAVSYYHQPLNTRHISGYRVEQRGGVPDFKWYQKTFPNDYSSGQDLPRYSRKKQPKES